mmetsp:Transcript_35247/g.60896  ORF Transcript_35247/g.60896 Transcript_35247/m.60896 type:complete len:228 (-) Transcript_35247:105-788(-)|eukprot:CAMPEP_0205905326 /NCGR_PEP_ID=MMETSP1325-20131115/1279_1 /ASSEMBLY_ACC=CAM_ASM_000708 /TAXON_ID=236786 /ORGANISM="Florenciella sp., Strain RCC1007" /LENGTH=227 /DNA_ID=CAMNT_0053271223 /DNA_START=27 /DNA_END=710 /DNA_ORIENTATION=-
MNKPRWYLSPSRHRSSSWTTRFFRWRSRGLPPYAVNDRVSRGLTVVSALTDCEDFKVSDRRAIRGEDTLHVIKMHRIFPVITEREAAAEYAAQRRAAAARRAAASRDTPCVANVSARVTILPHRDVHHVHPLQKWGVHSRHEVRSGTFGNRHDLVILKVVNVLESLLDFGPVSSLGPEPFLVGVVVRKAEALPNPLGRPNPAYARPLHMDEAAGAALHGSALLIDQY